MATFSPLDWFKDAAFLLVNGCCSELPESYSDLDMSFGKTFFPLDWSFKVLPILLGTLPPEIPDYNNGSTLGCPTGWTKSSINSKRCYNIYSSTTSQNLAQTHCAKFFGSLLSIQNAFENNAVQSLFLYHL